MDRHGEPIRRVLFVCMGNICRSPMAEALAHALLGNKVRAESAGVAAETGAPATENAIRVMEERGLDIRRHRARSVHGLKLGDFDRVVALTPSIAQTLRDRGADDFTLRTLDIDDPYGDDLAVYRATALAIERDLMKLFGVGEKNRRTADAQDGEWA